MTINGIDSAFLQKLLNRCAARSVMEGATETYETVIAASELMRYIFESRETVPLSEEIRIVGLYFSSFLNDPESENQYTIQACGLTAYVRRLSVLAGILAEIRDDQGSCGLREYYFAGSDGLQLMVRKGGSEFLISDIPVL